MWWCWWTSCGGEGFTEHCVWSYLTQIAAYSGSVVQRISTKWEGVFQLVAKWFNYFPGVSGGRAQVQRYNRWSILKSKFVVPALDAVETVLEHRDARTMPAISDSVLLSDFKTMGSGMDGFWGGKGLNCDTLSFADFINSLRRDTVAIID